MLVDIGEPVYQLTIVLREMTGFNGKEQLFSV